MLLLSRIRASGRAMSVAAGGNATLIPFTREGLQHMAQRKSQLPTIPPSLEPERASGASDV
jgi:hypothetical protein